MSSSPLANVRRMLAERSLDAVLVTSPFNRRYLSQFTAEDHAPDESSGVMLIGSDHALLLTSSTNGPWAKAEAVGCDVEFWERPWESFVAKRANDLGYARIGFEDRSTVVSTYSSLTSAGSKIEWFPVGGAIDQLRAIKTRDELAELSRAVELTDQIFAELVETIKVGESEREIGWRIERLTRERTDGAVAFHPIVASGPHAARPHHALSDRLIQPNEPIIIDMGVTSRGYCGDLTRTIWFGDATPRLRDVYNAVNRANLESIAAIGPDVPVKDVDRLARCILAEAGYGDHVLHSLGHGLGLRVHEAPSLSAHSDEVLQVGHVVTVEPGIYIDGWGGVRIEDVVVVTADGCRVLTAAPKQGGQGL